MSSQNVVYPKSYIDRGVQTDTAAGTRVSSPAQDLSVSVSRLNISLSSEESAEESTHPRSPISIQFDSAHSHTSDHSTGSSPTLSMSATARAYKERIPHNAPRSARLQAVVSSRIVSLPDTLPVYSAKANMDTAKLRVVSLPLPILEESSFLSDTSGPSGGCARFADKEENIRIRVQSHGAELSHTPSPPSSPESVVIIAHKNELADSFLRNTHDEGSPSVHSDDAGWISWAKSPPRPIPALHGPLSLPYARCPSGAEGTIIEEQENLPRMIWGLEGEETSSRPRSETITQVPSNQTLPRSAPTAGYHSVPPRLQKARSEAVPNLTSRLEKMIRQDVGRARTNNNKSQAPHNQPRQEVVGYPLRGQEPIDLADILRNESEGHSGGLHLDYGLPNTLGHGAIHHDLLGYGLQDQSGTNWSAALLTPDLVRDVGLLPAATSLDSDLNSQVHSAMSSPSVSSLRYMLGSSHSPLIVDSPGRLSHSSQNVSLPRRMSALEIAQQYRQQLLMQQKLPLQATLPTPPSSSSPIWSANFSPYQDSVISPELLPVSGHSRYPPAGLQPQHLRLHADPDPIAQRTPQDKHDSLGIPSRKSKISSLAPAAHILNNLGEPRFGDLPLRGTPTMASLINKLERQTIRNPQLQSQVQRPPVRARPSSAASRVPLYTHDASASTAAPRAPATQIPSSPTSPKQRSRSITHQQARSIPLTRLIQRRLSSVPEEDVSVPSEKDQPRSPATQKQYRARSQSTGDPAKSSQVHFLLSSPNPLSDDPRASSPAQTTFLPQSTSPEGDTASDALLTSQPAQATVKLPGASGKGAPQSGEDASSGQARKEEHNRAGNQRREGTNGPQGRSNDNNRGRGQKRGTRGRRGRGYDGGTRIVNGPERVDGGLVVKS